MGKRERGGGDGGSGKVHEPELELGSPEAQRCLYVGTFPTRVSVLTVIDFKSNKYCEL